MSVTLLFRARAAEARAEVLAKDCDSLEAQLSQLRQSIEGEVARLRKPKSAEFPDFEGGYASAEEDIADRLEEALKAGES